MKTILRKTAIAAAFIAAIAASSFSANAQENTLVYNKSLNPTIGISVESATGASYAIRDKKGNIVLTGIVKGEKTFFIPTSRLAKGTYQFVIGSFVLQEFIIK